MIRQIVRDEFFLSQPAEPATRKDLSIGQDLLDTLKANRDVCVGLAANMIGQQKTIIAINMGFVDLVMFNPKILAQSDPYQTEESCLSLTGSRSTTRYQTIKLTYLDMNWRQKSLTLTDFPAQIVQHEMDHCQGIII